jgi:hypothetical protein
MDQVINELKSKGLDPNQNPQLTKGLGDVVESTLTKFGITQERYKQWFGLQECNCTERKKWLKSFYIYKPKWIFLFYYGNFYIVHNQVDLLILLWKPPLHLPFIIIYLLKILKEPMLFPNQWG